MFQLDHRRLAVIAVKPERQVIAGSVDLRVQSNIETAEFDIAVITLFEARDEVLTRHRLEPVDQNRGNNRQREDDSRQRKENDPHPRPTFAFARCAHDCSTVQLCALYKWRSSGKSAATYE